MTKELEHKGFNQKPPAGELAGYLEKNFPGGTYYPAYEAGFCGFHARLELLKRNIHNIMVNAADAPATHKKKAHKDDRRDSRKIARGLRNGELEAIYVLLRKTIEDRMLYRARIAIVKDLRRCKQRIKAMLDFLGIGQPFIFSAPGTRWPKRCMDWPDGIKMEHDTGDYALKMLAGEAEELRKRLPDTNKKLRKPSCSEACKDGCKLAGSIPGIALVADLAFCNLCERMEGNKAIVRIARKLLNRIYYTLKNKTGYACGMLE